jgi:hypothetical protein
MEKWRRVWREGIAPNISEKGLRSLQLLLRFDSSRVIQGSVSVPPNLAGMHEMMPVAACAIGICGWQGEGCKSVAQVEGYFHRVCDAADSQFDEPATTRYFLNWFDETPREVMRREMLSEVALALKEKNHE